MKRLRLIFLMLPLLVAWAAAPAQAHGWACWAKASARYHVPVDLLYSIAHVETHNQLNLIHRNWPGNYDIGLMQINSSWLPSLRRYGITEKRLRRDPCLNLEVGAWILAQGIQRYGMNWRGVGSYNASTPYLQARYARSVADELDRIRRYGYGR